MKWLATIGILLLSLAVSGQDTILVVGQTFLDTDCDTSLGVTVNRRHPVKFIFKNNSVTGCNVVGYMLEAGQEVPTNYTNNLRGAEIIGNKFNWVGDEDANTITHGIFTGYNTDVKVMYNYLDHVPMSIIRKSDGMTDSTGVVAYNIIVSPPAVGVVVKGMNGVRIYNNTFYSADSLQTAPGIGTNRGLIEVYENNSPRASAKGAKIKNNIFYTKNQIYNIKVEEACLEDFECDYNIYWCESGTPIFSIGGSRKTWEQWRALGYDAHSMILNPHFEDFINFKPGIRVQWGTPTEFEWGIAASDYWVTGSDMHLVKQRGYWQQGARVYEGDMVIIFRRGHLFYGDSSHVELSYGKLVISEGDLWIEL